MGGLTMRMIGLTLAFSAVWLLASHVASAEEQGAKEQAELAKAVTGAKVSLEKGLAARQAQGTPISGKFEIEDGKLQLSVYTQKSASFSEVVVDHETGKVSKSEAITGGEDLDAAKAQGAAMAKAKTSLAAALKKALQENEGSRAVSVTPSLKDGHPVADVTLVKGGEFRTVPEKLD
jgi:hypothetical protein